MRTIIQHIGPLYGEPNTGTVFGQPNGSVAVGQGYAPVSSPTGPKLWNIDYPTVHGEKYEYLLEYRGLDEEYFESLFWSNSTGTDYTPTQNLVVNLIGDVPDLTSHIQAQFSATEDFKDILLTKDGEASNFSSFPGFKSYIYTDVPTNPQYNFVNGTTYYFRLALVSSSGTGLGRYSNVLPFTCVVKNEW